MTTAIYPGSFDPITNGHVSILRGGLVAFDRLVVAVLQNPKKSPLFTVDERIEMLKEAVGNDPRVEIDTFEGLLVDYAKRKNARVVLRGLRAVADFEYELQLANMNRHLNEEVETVFIMAKDAYFYVSSNLVKEAAKLGGDVSKLVPPGVNERLLKKLGTPT
ncbi:MAG: pantetheine-phosphate adenylyltransferase [Sandaracinaceae bacterium]|jgi:pantetheine-phosphate adenylyltransferase|nr:pantetheine-phosphate adenylyltransferase [Sandaracinaceae bacterium]